MLVFVLMIVQLCTCSEVDFVLRFSGTITKTSSGFQVDYHLIAFLWHIYKAHAEAFSQDFETKISSAKGFSLSYSEFNGSTGMVRIQTFVLTAICSTVSFWDCFVTKWYSRICRFNHWHFERIFGNWQYLIWFWITFSHCTFWYYHGKLSHFLELILRHYKGKCVPKSSQGIWSW